MLRDQVAALELPPWTDVAVSPETYCHEYVYPVPDPPEGVHTTGGSIFGGFDPLSRKRHNVVLRDAVTEAQVVAPAVFDCADGLFALSYAATVYE